MEPAQRRLNVLLTELREPIASQGGRVPLFSTVTGSVLNAAGALDAEHWLKQITEPVQFDRAVRSMADSGVDMFLEIGPHPVLCTLGSKCTPETATWIPSQHRKLDGITTLVRL